MKVACISDPHIMWDNPVGRTDNVLNTSLAKMDYVLNYCYRNNLILLIAGDVTDKPRSWIVLPQIIELFRRYKQVKVFVVYGQHDAYMRESRRSTILGTLIRSRLVHQLGGFGRVLNAGMTSDPSRFVYGYGCSWEDIVPEPKRKGGHLNILVIHAAISHNEKHTDEAEEFLKRYKFDFVLCGDIHKAFIYGKDGKYIVNTGPMMRGKATKEMFEHEPHFLVYNTHKVDFEVIPIPHLPANEVLTREHIESDQEVDEVLKSFISAVRKGISLRHKRLSKTFKRWAKDNDVEREVRDLIVDILMEIEEAKDS